MLKAVIFDFDGLLIDTESCDYQAWLEIYREYNLDYPLHEWQQLIGRYFPIPEPLVRLDKLKGPLDRNLIDTRRKKRSLELALQKPLLPGVRDLINLLQENGTRMAIASSSPRSWLDHFLAPHGLGHFFEVIVTGDTVNQVKPSPDVFLSAIEQMGIDKHKTLVLEDSRNGLLAAKSAGLRCVIIPSTLTRGMDFNEADLIVDSLNATSLSELQALVMSHEDAQEEKK